MKRPVPDEVVLGLLKEREAHGYELLERFRSRSELGRVWTMSTSQLYAVLKRLEGKGMVSGREVSVAEAPTKIVLTITDLGISRLESWLEDPHPSASIHLMRVIFISRLYIANLLGYPTKEMIDNQKNALTEQRSLFLFEQERAKNAIELMTIDFVIGQINAALKWLDECEETLNSPRLS